jgi:hypothetical protein
MYNNAKTAPTIKTQKKIAPRHPIDLKLGDIHSSTVAHPA